MTKIEKARRKVNDAFKEQLQAAFLNQFDRELETYYDFFGSGGYVSKPADGKPFLVKQKDFVMAFELGYLAAKSQVKE